MDRQRVILAELLRPRGNKGEILAKSQTDVPGRLGSIRTAQARLADGLDLEVELETAWLHGDDWVLKFTGVDSIAEADRFRGAELWVRMEKRAALGEGEYFQSDLIGCQVTDTRTGRLIGTVEGWQQYGGPPLMQVAYDGREVLIPFVPAYCRSVDVAAGTLLMELPDGLLDL